MSKNNVVLGVDTWLLSSKGSYKCAKDRPAYLLGVNREGLLSQYKVEYKRVENQELWDVFTDAGFATLEDSARVATVEGDFRVSELHKMNLKNLPIICERYIEDGIVNIDNKIGEMSPRLTQYLPDNVRDKVLYSWVTKCKRKLTAPISIERPAFSLITPIFQVVLASNNGMCKFSVDNKTFPCEVRIEKEERKDRSSTRILAITANQHSGIKISWIGQESRMIAGGLLVR